MSLVKKLPMSNVVVYSREDYSYAWTERLEVGLNPRLSKGFVLS